MLKLLRKLSVPKWIKTALAIPVVALCCSVPTLSGQNIDMSMEKVTVKKAFEYLQRNYNYSFVLKTDEIDINKLVTVKATGASITAVLDQIFRGQPVEYIINDSTISIVSRPKQQSSVAPQPASAQPRYIEGVVLDENSQPLIGATVFEEGSSNGVATDVNGAFRLRLTAENPVVVVSYIGFENIAVPLRAGQTELRVKMQQSHLAMDEVVVVGYGSMTRSAITSAIGSFKPGDTDQRPVLSVDQLLQGHVAGVNITTASGVPGAVSRVSIRGIGSLNAGNEPLYVVDGIPINSTSGDTGVWIGDSMSGLVSINPSDVESVEVLKDAASAAIYGSRGTNGVIIITTKKGRKGAPQVSVDGSVGISNLTRTENLEMADGDLFIEVLNEAIDNYNIQTGSSVQRYTNHMPGKAKHNWLDDILRTGVSYNTSASISGGSDKMIYYVSGNYKHTEGVMLKNDLDQYNFKINLSGEIKPWLSFGVNSALNYTNNKRIPTGYVGVNPIKAAVEQYPWDEPYLPSGEWATSTNVLVNRNPLQNVMEEDVFVDTYRALSSLFFDFRLAEGLTFKTSLGEDFHYTEEHIYYTSQHDYGSGPGGQLIDSRRGRLSLLWENTLSYAHRFDGGLNLDVVLGHSAQTDISSSASQTGLGFPSSSFDVNSVASSFTDVSTGRTTYSLQSYFGRVNLSYRNRYVLTATLRADGSSKFAPENRYGYFPSAGLGWNIHEENWWNAPKISVKPRVSWGSTGNQGGIGAYAYQALATGGFNYNGVNGLGLSTVGNRDLQWEKATQYNAGIDMAFFSGALQLTADVFRKDTKNLLYNKPTMATSGYTSYMCNIGSMSNEGLELSVSANLGKKDFRWNGNFNISFIRNKLTQLLDDNEIITVSNMHALKVGEEVGGFYMIKFLGIYQSDEEVPQYLYDNEGVRAGDCIYEDYNGDGKINSDDKQFVGSPSPKFSGGFNNTFTYKNFELGVFFTYSYGNMLYQLWNGGLRLGNGTYPLLESASKGRWTGPGTTNETPRAIYGYTWNSTKFNNTRYLHDASYLRLRSLTLGYTFPSKMIGRTGLSYMRMYVQADNLFVLTRWPYLDPEVTVSSSATSMGYDWLNPSQPRTITLGINLKF